MAERRRTPRVAALVAAGLPAVAAIAVLLIADPFGPGDEGEITAAIERAATSTDPGYCQDSVTLAYLEQRSGYRGRAALEDCRALAGEQSGLPEEVTIESVQIDGATAAAEVRYRGGAYDGALVSLSLIDDEGWRVDRLEGFEDLDRAVYEDFYRDRLLAPPFEFEPETADCMVERVVGLPPAELAASLVEFDPLATTSAAVACDRAAVEQLIASTFARSAYGLEPIELTCALAAAERMSDKDLAGLYAKPLLQRELLASCEQGA